MRKAPPKTGTRLIEVKAHEAREKYTTEQLAAFAECTLLLDAADDDDRAVAEEIWRLYGDEIATFYEQRGYDGDAGMAANIRAGERPF